MAGTVDPNAPTSVETSADEQVDDLEFGSVSPEDIKVDGSGEMEGVKFATKEEADAASELAKLTDTGRRAGLFPKKKEEKATDLEQGFFRDQHYADKKTGEADMAAKAARGDLVAVRVGEGDKAETRYLTIEQLAQENGYRYRLTETPGRQVTKDAREMADFELEWNTKGSEVVSSGPIEIEDETVSDTIPLSGEFTETRTVGKGKQAEEVPLYEGDPAKGEMKFPKDSTPEQQKSALRSAAYDAAQGAGLSHEAAATYARDVMESVRTDENGENPDYQARLGDVNNAAKDKEGFKSYQTPADYAASRSLPEGADEEEVKKFKEEYAEQHGKKSEQEQWDAVYRVQADNREEYRQAVTRANEPATFGEGDVGEWASTDGRKGEALDTANAVLRQTEGRITELEEKRGEVLRQIDTEQDTAKLEELGQKRKDLDAELATARADRDKTEETLRDALQNNPKKLARMSKEAFPDDADKQFIPSKGELSSGAKAREETTGTAGRVIDKIGKVGTHIGTVSGAVQAPAKAVTDIVGAGIDVASIPKKMAGALTNDKLPEMLTSIMEQNKELTTAAMEREVPTEFVKGSADYGTPKDKKTANREALEAGNQAGTAPTAQPGNMFARKKDAKGGQQGPDGGKSDRTKEIEDLADQARAQRALNRYT